MHGRRDDQLHVEWQLLGSGNDRLGCQLHGKQQLPAAGIHAGHLPHCRNRIGCPGAQLFDPLLGKRRLHDRTATDADADADPDTHTNADTDANPNAHPNSATDVSADSAANQSADQSTHAPAWIEPPDAGTDPEWDLGAKFSISFGHRSAHADVRYRRHRHAAHRTTTDVKRRRLRADLSAARLRRLACRVALCGARHRRHPQH